MKFLKYSILFLVIALTFSACDEFLTYEPSDSVNDVTAFKTAKDVENGLNGVYYSMGRFGFFGRNVVALGDIAADNCYMTGSSGHFDQIYKYTMSVDSPDLLEIWDAGYKTINRSSRVIKAATEMLENGGLSSTDQETVKSAIAQAYGVKALSHFSLVNIFGLPYNETNKTTSGIVIVGDEPIVAFQTVSRGTVGQTYEQILSDIASARTYISSAPSSVFVMNKAALDALEARVKLYMQDWSGAIVSAQSAISNSGGEIEYNPTDYLAMWKSVSPTSEDIFSVAKLSNDNLSANSINTLYGSYDGKATSGLVNLFDPADMRFALFGGTGEMVRAMKYQGIPSSDATSNIPVFRLPEMYLIIAEAKAELGQADAVDFLYAIAKRNPSLDKASIPTDKVGLLEFISVERRRELFQEGHRWFDMRRTGEILTREGGNYAIKNWDPSSFVYPIPSQEVNASGIAQNVDWNKNLPK